jgi:hypothetical protein
LAPLKAGNNRAAKMAMMAMTTNNSIKVKPTQRAFRLMIEEWWRIISINRSWQPRTEPVPNRNVNRERKSEFLISNFKFLIERST